MEKNLSSRMYPIKVLAGCMVFRTINRRNAFRYEPFKVQSPKSDVELLGQPPTIVGH
jgi:hypothetical protein